jgi:hypothetical protein
VPAPNYHYHCHLRCEYNDSTATAGTPHSPLVGLMLDGRGLYGMYESGLTMPTNLDACGGHHGPVPATTINGVTYPAASNVYHYHMQHQARCRRGEGCMGTALHMMPRCTARAGSLRAGVLWPGDLPVPGARPVPHLQQRDAHLGVHQQRHVQQLPPGLPARAHGLRFHQPGQRWRGVVWAWAPLSRMLVRRAAPRPCVARTDSSQPCAPSPGCRWR